MKLADQTVQSLPLTTYGQHYVNDDAVPGLTVCVGMRTKFNRREELQRQLDDVNTMLEKFDAFEGKTVRQREREHEEFSRNPRSTLLLCTSRRCRSDPVRRWRRH